MDVLNPAKVDNFLFHYTRREKALEGILQGQPSLRLGRFTDTKDPYEFKKWNVGAGASGTNELERTHSRIRDAAGRLQSALRVACLTRDCLLDGEATPVEIRGFGLSRMWDRYGEGHRGFCLAFDKLTLGLAVGETINAEEPNVVKRLVTGPSTWWAEDVNYAILARRSPAEWSVDADLAQEKGSEDHVVAHHVATHYRRFLFLKSKDWEGEREYRYVYWGTPETPELDVPITGALRAIFIGLEFPKVYLPTLRALCPEGTTIYDMRWFMGQLRQPLVV